MIVYGDEALGIDISDPVREFPQGWSVNEHDKEHSEGITLFVKNDEYSKFITLSPYSYVVIGVTNE